MTTDFSNFSYLPGSSVVARERLIEDLVHPAAGIAVTPNGNGGVWIDRIVCHGVNVEEAQALRDRVLHGLQLVADQEHEEEASRRSFEHLKASGLVAVGTAHIGAKVISAGLGGKDD